MVTSSLPIRSGTAQPSLPNSEPMESQISFISFIRLRSLERRSSETSTRGGSSDTAVNAFTVAPWRSPSGVRQVTTTVTPVARYPRHRRRSRGSSAISSTFR